MANNSAKKKSLRLALGSVLLKDTGRSIGGPDKIELPTNKDTTSYPSVYVSSKDVPALEGYEAGDYVVIVAHACIRTRSLDENKDGGHNEDFRLDLEKIGVVAKKSGEEGDQKEGY